MPSIVACAKRPAVKTVCLPEFGYLGPSQVIETFATRTAMMLSTVSKTFLLLPTRGTHHRRKLLYPQFLVSFLFQVVPDVFGSLPDDVERNGASWKEVSYCQD